MEWFKYSINPMDIEHNHNIAMRFMPQFWMHSEDEHSSMEIERLLLYCTEYTPGHLRILNDRQLLYITQNRDTLQVLYNIVSTIDENNENVTDIVYCLFFPYSVKRCLCWNQRESIHMPRVTIRFRCQKSMVTHESTPWMVLMSMRNRYRWYEWPSDDLEKVNHRLQVYISKNTHLCYPKSGTYVRFTFNDICNRGYTINDKSINMIPFHRLNPIFMYKTVLNNDFSWCDRSLEFGESPSYSPYAASTKGYIYRRTLKTDR